MKKTIYLLLSTILFSCANEETNLMDELAYSNNQMELKTKRSIVDAMAVAQESLCLLDNVKTRSENQENRTIDYDSGIEIVTRSLTQSTSKELDTLLYVFNFNDNKGFAIVSANLNTEALIAVTEKGHYNPMELQENEGFNTYMQLAKVYVSNSQNQSKNVRSLDRIQQHRYYEEVISETSYPKMINLEWGQRDVQGNLCPNGLCGCSPLAIAMVMSYYESPTSMSMDFNPSNIHTVYFDWDDMKNHIRTHSSSQSSCGTSNTGHNMISELCRQIGKKAGSSYDIFYNGSTLDSLTSTTIPGMCFCLNQYGYNASSESFSQSNIISYLGSGHPIIVNAMTSPYGGGHTWVLDGYKSKTYYIHEQVKNEGDDLWTDINVYGPVSYAYNHMNWGFDGHSNGWFSTSVYNMANPAISDNSLSLGNLNLQYNLSIILSYPN